MVIVNANNGTINKNKQQQQQEEEEEEEEQQQQQQQLHHQTTHALSYLVLRVYPRQAREPALRAEGGGGFEELCGLLGHDYALGVAATQAELVVGDGLPFVDRD
jgi:hypothetical protein